MLVIYKTVEEAAVAVDEMFNFAFQTSGSTSYPPRIHFTACSCAFAAAPGDDSGEDSEDEAERPAQEEDDEADGSAPESPVSSGDTMSAPFIADDLFYFQDKERAPSPDPVVVLSAQENLGPSEEADAEFAKELAKMVTDSSTESRKVDKKTALALWDSAVLPPGARKRRLDDSEADGDPDSNNVEARNMTNFTVITKRGNKQQVCFDYIVVTCKLY
jgi:regulator of nonsense transcripts 2